jgi:uncharacterized alkaline shock family protein YloU
LAVPGVRGKRVEVEMVMIRLGINMHYRYYINNIKKHIQAAFRYILYTDCAFVGGARDSSVW